MEWPQIQTTITDGNAISTVVDAPWVSVTSLNGMTGDVIVEPVIKSFQSNHYYLKDSVVTYNGALYFAKRTFTSGGSFNVNDWNTPDFTQVQADWNENDSTAKSYIQNKPAVNNGTLTIQKNGVNVATFSANTASNTTANISVPTKTSEITNNSGFITSNDLPTVNNATLTIQKNATTINTFTANSATNKTVNIVVPTDTGDLTNNAGYLKANDVYPVGSIVTFYDTADHSNFLGLTWVRFAAGKMVVGYDSSDEDFDTIGNTGGAKTVTLTVDQMPSHRHALNTSNTTVGSGANTTNDKVISAKPASYWNNNAHGEYSIQYTGGGQAHENMPPYITAALWRRTA